MNEDSNPPERVARFYVTRAPSGLWQVIDGLFVDRLVASCPVEDEACAVAALMNRDPIEALRRVRSSLERLDSAIEY